MITGEWAVLENHPCIVAAVNKRVHSNVEKSEKLNIIIDDFYMNMLADFKDGKIVFENITIDDEKKLVFIKAAIETAVSYASCFKPFKIHTWGEESQLEVEGKQVKIGFGSSAASVVAVIASVLDFLGINPEKEVVYKLSAIAHYYAQGKIGSAFDVAASTFGGALVYTRFNEPWLVEQIKSRNIKDIVKDKWPGFYVENLETPSELEMIIGFVGSSASTKEMILQMNAFKESQQQEYGRLYSSIGSLVKETIGFWKAKQWNKAMENINKNQEILRELTIKSGVKIEIEKLRKLHEIAKSFGACGKLSGAGGGDCGIALCFDHNTAEKIKNEWKNNGIHIVDATIDKEGLRKE